MVGTFKEFRLYCCHSVSSFGPDHKCARKHGHTYKIRVTALGSVNKDTMIVVPFEKIEEVWSTHCAHLDHTDLNSTFVNPTTEVLAMYIHGKMTVHLGLPVEVEVKETESSGVIIR